MKIYNVLTRKKEEFVTINPGKVKMYVCGMTVNGEQHLGHARQVIVFDMVNNYLKFKGYDVEYASNFTDIDDKIIAQAKERDITPVELANERIKTINNITAQIAVSEPVYKPRVTMCIPEIIAFAQGLVDKGYAYVAKNGDVYFSVKKYKAYGTLSNRKIDDLLNSVRIEAADNKIDALDFALWKAVDVNEFGWDSPWGKGRPGWHIECSAMIKKFLANKIDIHGGGKDLIFPHHENELAQSSCLNDCALASFWMHNGLITVNGQKMSKSLGNFILTKDLLKNYDAEIIRYAILINHYTSTLDMGDNAMIIAEKKMYYFYNSLIKITELLQGHDNIEPENFLVDLFVEAFDDDFNSAKFIAELFNVFAKALTTNDLTYLKSVIFGINKTKDVLGLFRKDYKTFVNNIKQKHLLALGISEEEIVKIIENRNNYKQEKNYQKADELRAELDQKGIILKDSKQGTLWDIKALY